VWAARTTGARLTFVTLRAIHHVQLAMPAGEEVRAAEVYVAVLGFVQVPKPPHLAGRGGCWFEADGVRVHLGVEPDFRPAKKAHPALVVDDLDALTRRCADAGIEVRDGDGLDGYDQAYVDDPFGNRIELLEAQ
jgi:catechol 2,3-dioxygenase-like lactoylglutathione lyase family enzyme